MEILNFINTNIVRYLYIIVIIGIIITLIKTYTDGIAPLVKTLDSLLKKINETSKDANKISEDLESISYTLNNSIPFFVDLAFYIITIRAILKDYFKTKKSKRSIIRSAFNEYQNVSRKYNRTLNPEAIKEIAGIITPLVM